MRSALYRDERISNEVPYSIADSFTEKEFLDRDGRYIMEGVREICPQARLCVLLSGRYEVRGLAGMRIVRGFGRTRQEAVERFLSLHDEAVQRGATC